MAIRDLVRSDARGVLHLTNSGSYSSFEFVKEVYAEEQNGLIALHPPNMVFTVLFGAEDNDAALVQCAVQRSIFAILNGSVIPAVSRELGWV
jgi:hypothetical protein